MKYQRNQCQRNNVMAVYGNIEMKYQRNGVIGGINGIEIIHSNASREINVINGK
jgi:hypothetical protein